MQWTLILIGNNMEKWNKISIVMLTIHIVIVCLVSGFSYCDITRNHELMYLFRIGYLLHIPNYLGNLLELCLYYLSIPLFPIVALIFALKQKLRIKNTMVRFLCHLMLGIFQFFAFVPLIS